MVPRCSAFFGRLHVGETFLDIGNVLQTCWMSKMNNKKVAGANTVHKTNNTADGTVEISVVVACLSMPGGLREHWVFTGLHNMTVC